MQRRSWSGQLGLGLTVLILALVDRALGGGWLDIATRCLLVVCAIVMLVRGRPGERLFVVSVGLSVLVALGVGVGLALML